jgi:hypothetical protein
LLSNKNIEDACTTLEAIHYEGEKKGFNFEKCNNKHNKAFLKLSRYGEPVLETKKVQDFLNKINASELAVAKQQVCATPALLGNFQETDNFIALTVIPFCIPTRNIASVSADENPYVMDTSTSTHVARRIKSLTNRRTTVTG